MSFEHDKAPSRSVMIAHINSSVVEHLGTLRESLGARALLITNAMDVNEQHMMVELVKEIERNLNFLWDEKEVERAADTLLRVWHERYPKREGDE